MNINLNKIFAFGLLLGSASYGPNSYARNAEAERIAQEMLNYSDNLYLEKSGHANANPSTLAPLNILESAGLSRDQIKTYQSLFSDKAQLAKQLQELKAYSSLKSEVEALLSRRRGEKVTLSDASSILELRTLAEREGLKEESRLLTQLLDATKKMQDQFKNLDVPVVETQIVADIEKATSAIKDFRAKFQNTFAQLSESKPLEYRMLKQRFRVLSSAVAGTAIVGALVLPRDAHAEYVDENKVNADKEVSILHGDGDVLSEK